MRKTINLVVSKTSINMSIISFYKDFPDELICKLHFKKHRDEKGVICKKCACTNHHYWKQDSWQYECKSCSFRTTLRSGTVMHKSKLSYSYCYTAMHLLIATKKSFQLKKFSVN